MTDLSRDEFYRVVDDLKNDRREDMGDIKTELGEIRDHLALLSRRAGKSDLADANLRVRLERVEESVLHHPRRRRADHAGEGEAWVHAFSKREYLLMTAGFGIVTLLAQSLLTVTRTVYQVATTLLAHYFGPAPP